MNQLPYVEVDYNMARRLHPDETMPTWIARCSEVDPPKVNELVAIGDGEIDGGGIMLGRVRKVNLERQSLTPPRGRYPEYYIYVWVTPIEFEVKDLGFIDGH